MTQIIVKIKNLDKIQGGLRQSPVIFAPRLRFAINRSLDYIEAEAKPLTPVKTGRLVNSYKFGRINASGSMLRGRVMPRTKYAAAVHDLYSPGTRYKRPSKNTNAVAGFVEVGAKRADRKIQNEFNVAVERALNDIVK